MSSLSVSAASTSRKSGNMIPSGRDPKKGPFGGRKASVVLPYIPLSPRLQALASPIGPCTPFLLEDTKGSGDYVTAAAVPSTSLAQEKLDAAFARQRAGSAERKSYSSVLASQR